MAWDPKWRFDPAKGGVYDSSLDDDENQPLAAPSSVDTSAMPDATTPTFSAGRGGAPVSAPTAPAPAPSAPAPTAPASTGETFGIPNTTTPLTLTGDTSHTNISRKVTTAEDAIAQGAIANAADAQKDSLRTQGEIEAKQKLDEGNTAERRAGVYEANNKLRAKAMDDSDAAKAALATKAAEMQKVIDATKVTDGWANKSTGDKVIAALALIVNGIGRGLASDHGPDQLFASMQERIKRDHDEQIKQLDKMREQVAHLSGPARDQVEKELKLRLENIEAKQIGQLNAISETGKALAARTGSPLVVAQMGQKMAEVDATAADKKAAFLDKTRTEVQSGSQHEIKQVQPTGGPKKDTAVQDLSGKDIGEAKSPEEALKVHEAQASTTGFLGSLRRYRDHLLKYGRTFNDDPGVQQERTMLRNLVVGQMTGPMKSGVLNGGEGERYNGMIDTGIRNGGPEAAKAVDVLINETLGGYNSLARGLARINPGAEPVPKDFRAPAAGAAAPGGFGLSHGRAAASPSAPAPAAKPATAPQATQQFRNKKTGAMVTAYQHADGQWYPEP